MRGPGERDAATPARCMRAAAATLADRNGRAQSFFYYFSFSLIIVIFFVYSSIQNHNHKQFVLLTTKHWSFEPDFARNFGRKVVKHVVVNKVSKCIITVYSFIVSECTNYYSSLHTPGDTCKYFPFVL